MPNSYVPIYILRSQCKPCAIDTMRTFTLKGNEPPEEAYRQLERWVTQRWSKEHDCKHDPMFSREIEKDYRYSIKKQKAVRM